MALINRGNTVLAAGDRNNALFTAEIFYGDAANCQDCFLDVDNNPTRHPAGIGSVYLSTRGGGLEGNTGAMFFKATNVGNPGDWLIVGMVPCGGGT